MKHIYLFVLFSSVMSFISMSQTFTWTTNDTIIADLAQNTTVQLLMSQQAIGEDPVTLGIEVIHNDLPSYWDGMLCIQGACLGTIPVVGTTAEMLPISGTDQGYVRLTVNPLNGNEEAKLQVYVFDVNFPNDGDTATWLLNSASSLDEIGGNDYNTVVYPNPVSNMLSFDSDLNIEKIEIYNQAGVLCKSVKFNAFQDFIDVSDLEVGLYNITFSGDNNFVVKRFVK